MQNLTNKKRTILFIGIMLLVSILLIILQDLRKSTDEQIETLFLQTRGEILPDTNIIIIHFSEEDIARIGPWPIKRNYYALLINQLSNLGIKKIGLEIFLSSRLVTQSIYDNLLRKEIEKAGNVVLSSVAGQITSSNGNFYTDSLSFPTPKLLDENIPTGHINYLYDYSYKIPLIIANKDIEEKAFSYQLSELELKKNYILANFVSSWKKFQNYSALEFAQMVYDDSTELNRFKNKIVILGISDKQIAVNLKTPFDNQLPGIAFHAFALDNLLNDRSFNDNYYELSIIISLLAIFAFILIRNGIENKIIIAYLLTGILFLTIIFILNALLYIKVSHSILIIPFLSVGAADAILYLLKERKQLKGITDEAALLRNLLLTKEKELLRLQNEIYNSGEETLQMKEKIESLRRDIDKLKENEDDKSKADFDIKRKPENFYGIIYTSNSIKQITELIRKAAPTDSTILITGESGTGKELVAKAIHSLSKRNDKSFIAVNCSALPDSLLESELFGHVKGSFTGAISDKPGRFEIADEGTIFLDEIGETTENFQVKLLRVLQSGEIEKIGSTKNQRVNVRVVAATNKNLIDLIKEKKFREDLYYRLNVITIELPPLRERKDDIEVLAKYFLNSVSNDIGISKAVLQAFNDYQWKGNVRELQSVIKRAVIFVQSDKRNLIQLSDLPGEIVKETRFSFEELVLESLRNKNFSHSSITETAKELGNVNRTLISENFRGIVLRTLVENNFNSEKIVSIISGSDDQETNERVSSKINIFLNNIENDLAKADNLNFESIKNRFSSKYKNLPGKFHVYLDEILKWKISSGQK